MRIRGRYYEVLGERSPPPPHRRSSNYEVLGEGSGPPFGNPFSNYERMGGPLKWLVLQGAKPRNYEVLGERALRA
jgi:hypothetical protein